MTSRGLTSLAVAILELLNERPMHPYEMAQLMRQRHMSMRVKIKTGSLYHTVERLESQGFVEAVDTQREGRRPERTVYGITENGEAAFVERAKDMLGTVIQEYPEFVNGLAALDDLDPAEALAVLEHRILQLEAASAANDAVTRHMCDKELPRIYWLDWTFITARCNFELEWTRELVSEIKSGKLPWQRGPQRTGPNLASHKTTEEEDGKAH